MHTHRGYIHVSNVGETMIGWHTKRTLSTEHIMLSPRILFCFSFFYTTPWNCKSFEYHAHCMNIFVRKRENLSIETYIYKLSIIENFRSRWMINCSTSFFVRNFRVSINANKIRKKKIPAWSSPVFLENCTINKSLMTSIVLFGRSFAHPLLFTL